MRSVIGHARDLQVSFVGPFGVGKSTAVRAISDTPVVNTDVRSVVGRIPRPGSPRKETTTVGLDFGDWHSPSGRVVSVVGTPGQERFQTVRSSAVPRANAVVLWLFGDQTYGVDEGEEWVGFLGDRRTWERLTIAVTRLGDAPGCPQLRAYEEMAHRFDPAIPVVTADPRERDSVASVLSTALRGRLDAVSA